MPRSLTLLPLILFLSFSSLAEGGPLLRAYAMARLGDELAVDPGRPADFDLWLQNEGDVATNVVLRATLPAGGSFLAVSHMSGPDAVCTLAESELVCRIPTTHHEHRELTRFIVSGVPPDRDDGGSFPIRLTVEADQANAHPLGSENTAEIPMRRRFIVSSAADAGSGSLRQAIENSNAACSEQPCLIALRAQEPIRPQTPLPRLTGFVKIDGGNVRAELDGSLLSEGHALAGDICDLRLVRLKIHDFPGHAVEAWPSAACEGWPASAVALYVRSSELAGNLRGIVAKRVKLRAEENEIHENRRAGIFIDDSPGVTVRGNEIRRNGASGIFVDLAGPAASGNPPALATIKENTIRFNQEWGICRTRDGAVNITGNSIYRNFLYAIDVGLDLASPNVDDDRVGTPNKPLLVSAFYDPARNRTVVRGHAPMEPYGYTKVEIYTSDALSGGGYPDAQTRLGAWWVNGEFTIEVVEDLRGRWITATTTRRLPWCCEGEGFEDTSELSDAIQVQ